MHEQILLISIRSGYKWEKSQNNSGLNKINFIYPSHKQNPELRGGRGLIL